MKLKRAEEVFNKFKLFGQDAKYSADAKDIQPINNTILEKKERQKQKEMTAGKAWGEMPKVELTDELRNDLKAVMFRNQIFPKRFYKNNDSDKLPTYFQIGTIVDNSAGARKDRLTKKEQKKSIAQ